MRLGLAALAALLVGCPPSIAPDAGVDAGTAQAACANEDLLGCPAGADPLCPSRLRDAPQRGATTERAVACAAGARDVAALRRCDPDYFTCAK